MTSNTAKNARDAETTKQLAAKAREAADRIASDTKEMSQAMDQIRSSGDNISKIIKTIDEILNNDSLYPKPCAFTRLPVDTNTERLVWNREGFILVSGHSKP